MAFYETRIRNGWMIYINTAKQSVTKEAPLDIQRSITPELQAKVEQRLIEK